MARKIKNEELNRLTVEKFKEVPKTPMIIILDNIRSMHNVGAIFRTADAFLIEKIFLCGITAQPPHRDIRKTALGAEDSVDWEYVQNPIDVIKKIKPLYKIYALEQVESSIPLRDIEVKSQKLALILGNEVDGVGDELINHCDGFIEIPQFGTKHSFNVSVSAGIAMWELFNKVKNEKK